MEEGTTPANTPEATPPPLPPPPPPPQEQPHPQDTDRTGQPNARYTPDGDVYQSGQFSIGAVLKKSFDTLLKNPVLFFGLTILSTVPSLIVALVTEEESPAHALLTLISMFFGVVIQGAIAYGVFRTLKNEQAGFGDAIRRGLGHFLPLLCVAILYSLGAGIGTLLLIIPGLIIVCIWAVAVPACVVEKLGPIESLKRSAFLTRNYRWHIFGLMVLLIVITMALSMIVGAFLGAIGSSFLSLIGTTLITIVPSAFQSVMISTIYYVLRSVKEGVSVDNLSNVFD